MGKGMLPMTAVTTVSESQEWQWVDEACKPDVATVICCEQAHQVECHASRQQLMGAECSGATWTLWACDLLAAWQLHGSAASGLIALSWLA